MKLSIEALTACHEAGHALVAHLLGLTVHRAYVGPDPKMEICENDAMGATAFVHDGDWRKLVAVAAAGWSAEEMMFPGSTLDRGHDEWLITNLLQDEGFSKRQAQALIEHASEAIPTLLEPHRRTIVVIAYFLLEGGQISGRDVASLAVDESLPREYGSASRCLDL